MDKDKERRRLKMAIIVGASKAIEYKERHPNATESEVIRHINENIREILGKIDGDI